MTFEQRSEGSEGLSQRDIQEYSIRGRKNSHKPKCLVILRNRKEVSVAGADGNDVRNMIISDWAGLHTPPL